MPRGGATGDENATLMLEAVSRPPGDRSAGNRTVCIKRPRSSTTGTFSEQMDMPGVPGNTAHEKGCILPVVIAHKRDR